MHFCHGSVVSIKEAAKQAHEHCPMCASQKTDKRTNETNHSCNMGEQDCCNDVAIDLKKSDVLAEKAATGLSFLNLSPAITTLYWIQLFQVAISTPNNTTKPNIQPGLVAYKPPTYLIHCTFLI